MIETNCKLNIFSSPDEIGGVTDAEIQELTANAPEIEREQLILAAFVLDRAKLRCGNRTPWQELLVEFRSTLPCQVEASVVFQDGEIGIQTVVMDRGFGLTGDAQLMFSALDGLHDVLGRIENMDFKKYFNDGGYRLAQSKTASRPRPEAKTREARLREIGAWLTNREYKASVDKSGLIDGAMSKFKCGETDVRDAARIAGLTRSYKQSTK
jgi:hypothetical protein